MLEIYRFDLQKQRRSSFDLFENLMDFEKKKRENKNKKI